MKKRIKYPERLLKLADELEKDAKNKSGIKFDFNDWGTLASPFNAALVKDEKLTANCHTVACAMGLAAISGKFKRYGLNHRLERGNNWPSIEFVWKGRRVTGVQAAARLFGISTDDAYSLFVYGDYLIETTGAAAEQNVANEIRRFVKEQTL